MALMTGPKVESTVTGKIVPASLHVNEMLSSEAAVACRHKYMYSLLSQLAIARNMRPVTVLIVLLPWSPWSGNIAMCSQVKQQKLLWPPCLSIAQII